MNEKVKQVVKHLDALIQLLGLDKSESATEAFTYRLEAAVHKALEEISVSHDEGLCYDARWPLAEGLLKQPRKSPNTRRLETNSSLLRKAVLEAHPQALAPLYCVTLIQVADLIPTERFTAALESGMVAAKDYEQELQQDRQQQTKESIH